MHNRPDSIHTTMIYSASIFPGRGIGDFAVLHQLLYDTVSRIQKKDRPMSISYSGKDYLKSPIVVTLPTVGLRLIFRGSGKQPLILIEVLSFDKIKFSYNGIRVNDIDDMESTTTLPNLKEIYNKSFGPTFPGRLDLEAKEYTLSYLGITFKFAIRLKELLCKLQTAENASQILSKLTNWDTAGDIPCVNLAIHSEQNYEEFVANLRNPDPQRDSVGMECEIEAVDVALKEGRAGISYPKSSGRKPEALTIGETAQQDALRILGPPDAYANRPASQLRMHNNGHSNPAQDAMHIFYNYYRHGLDLLFKIKQESPGGAVLEKIILHNGGIAESSDFMQWNKCEWQLRKDTKSPVCLDSLLYFGEMQTELASVDVKNAGPILLNRNESEFTKDEDLEILVDSKKAQQDCELDSSGPSLGTCSNEFKTWGQLNLYGFQRCIFEVIESNGCVARVTVY